MIVQDFLQATHSEVLFASDGSRCSSRYLRVEFFIEKLIVGIPGMRKLLYSPWQTLGVPFALTPIGQLHQSPPSPVPGDRARGKRTGFSPGAAARQRRRTRVSTNLQSTFFLCFPVSEVGRLPRIFFAKPEIGHSSRL